MKASLVVIVLSGSTPSLKSSGCRRLATTYNVPLGSVHSIPRRDFRKCGTYIKGKRWRVMRPIMAVTGVHANRGAVRL